MKLSCMQRFRVKMHWFSSTKAPRLGDNLVANIFATNREKMCMRLKALVVRKGRGSRSLGMEH